MHSGTLRAVLFFTTRQLFMKIEDSFNLKAYNTFGLDVIAKTGIVLEQQDQLTTIARSEHQSPTLVIGEGSNILFTEDFDGQVIINRLKGIAVHEQTDAWLLHVAGGENWHDLVHWTLQHDMPGLENLALIPGTVGAAPVQNIGAYGKEFCMFCEYVDVWHLDTQEPARYTAEQCRFGYRDSIFKHDLLDKVIITAVGVRLTKHWTPSLEYGPLKELPKDCSALQIFEQVCQVRQQKLPDPKALGNAGSFFKNPVVPTELAEQLKQRYPTMPTFPVTSDTVKLAAGWLIDQAGLKGKSKGSAGIHQEQALVLVNLGGAKAAEIIAVAKRVAETVKERCGVQ